jgi:hypothetical protein
VGIRCADHATPLYPLKLALTSPTSGGRSVGIVRLQTKATEFVFVCLVPLEVKDHKTTCLTWYNRNNNGKDSQKERINILLGLIWLFYFVRSLNNSRRTIIHSL